MIHTVLAGATLALMLLLVYRRAKLVGTNRGIAIGLAIFRAKLPPETYRTICHERLAEIDALLHKVTR